LFARSVLLSPHSRQPFKKTEASLNFDFEFMLLPQLKLELNIHQRKRLFYHRIA